MQQNSVANRELKFTMWKK